MAVETRLARKTGGGRVKTRVEGGENRQCEIRLASVMREVIHTVRESSRIGGCGCGRRATDPKRCQKEAEKGKGSG